MTRMTRRGGTAAGNPTIKGRVPRTIAVLRALQLGDLLCSLPALRALRHAWPTAHISFIGLPWSRQFVARYARYLDEFIEFPGFPGLPERPVRVDAIPPFLSAMQQRRFDLVLQLHGSGHYTNEIATLLGGSMTAGFFSPSEYCPDADLFVPYPADLPEVRRHVALLRHLGLPVESEELEFPLTPDDEASFARLRDVASLAPHTFVCVHPGGRGHNRRWAPQQFAAVAERLARRGYEIVVTGTADEQDIAKAMIAAMQSNPINLVGQTDLGTMGMLLSRAKLLLANDTGVSHLAAALKVPSVIVCIGSDPIRWSPLDRHRHRVLSGDMATIDAVLMELADLLQFQAQPFGATCGLGAATLPVNNSESLIGRHHHYLTGL